MDVLWWMLWHIISLCGWMDVSWWMLWHIISLCLGWMDGWMFYDGCYGILYHYMDGWMDGLTYGRPSKPNRSSRTWFSRWALKHNTSVELWITWVNNVSKHCFSLGKLLYSQPLLWRLEIQKGLLGPVLPVIEQ